MTSKKKEIDKVLKKIQNNEKYKDNFTELEFATKQLDLFNTLRHKYGRYLKIKEKIVIAMGIKTAKTLKTMAIQKEKIEKKRKK